MKQTVKMKKKSMWLSHWKKNLKTLKNLQLKKQFLYLKKSKEFCKTLDLNSLVPCYHYFIFL